MAIRKDIADIKKSYTVSELYNGAVPEALTTGTYYRAPTPAEQRSGISGNRDYNTDLLQNPDAVPTAIYREQWRQYFEDVNTALQSRLLDPDTKKEIRSAADAIKNQADAKGIRLDQGVKDSSVSGTALYASLLSGAQENLAKTLEQAVAGEGIYKNRRFNLNQALAQEGLQKRSDTLSLGRKETLG